MLVFCEKTKKQHGETNPRESSRFATPAIRTLKISVFYPKNNQKSQILLVLGSRYTSDDSPTITQIYQQSLAFFCLFYVFLNRKQPEESKTFTEVNCNARHKDLKNKRVFTLNLVKKVISSKLHEI